MSYKHLDGIRVLDLGIITAGASTTAILSDLGADVIKVEGPGYIDPFRNWSGKENHSEWWNQSPYFSFTNRNKRGICIDLKSAEGREIFLQLVRSSDVLVENFRTGTMERLHLGVETLLAVNPRLVFASVSSQGKHGPESGSVSFGSTLEASSGLASLIHYADGVPLISGHALNYPDQVASLFAASAILSALFEREKTGRGAFIDISQRELAAFMLGEMIVADRPADSEAPVPDRVQAINIVVGSKEGRWIAISLDSSKDASDVARVLGGTDSQSDDILVNSNLRSADEIMMAVRAIGGSAEIVLNSADLPEEYSSRPDCLAFSTDGSGRPVKGLPWKHGDGAAPIVRSAPDLGENNYEIIVGVLNIDPKRYEGLLSSGVISTVPRKIVDTTVNEQIPASREF